MKPISKIKKILVITGAVLIMLIGISILSYHAAITEMECLHSSLCSTMTTLSNRYDRAVSINRTSVRINEDIEAAAEYIAELTDKVAPDGQTALELLKSRHADTYDGDSQMPGENSTYAGLSGNFEYFIADASDRKVFESGNTALNGTYIPDKLEVSTHGIDKKCRSKNETYIKD